VSSPGLLSPANPRATVVACTPSRRAIERSVSPPARARRAWANCEALSAGGRPRRAVNAAEPSRRARARSRDRYSSLMPTTSATRRAAKPSSGSVTAARLRRPASPASKSKTTRAPTEIVTRPSTSTRRRSVATGIPASMACAASPIPTTQAP